MDEATRSALLPIGAATCFTNYAFSPRPTGPAPLNLPSNIALTLIKSKELVKPIKEYSYRKENPPGFGGWAWGCDRLPLLATGPTKRTICRSGLVSLPRDCGFANSDEARHQVEQLLTDFTVEKARPAPSLPLYRLETESELPRIIPIAGQMPLAVDDFNAVPVAVPEEPFGLVTFAGQGAWIAVPGWQVIFQAEDPVGVLIQSRQLPNYPIDGANEQVLVVIDRAQREWAADSYFVIAEKQHPPPDLATRPHRGQNPRQNHSHPAAQAHSG